MFVIFTRSVVWCACPARCRGMADEGERAGASFALARSFQSVSMAVRRTISSTWRVSKAHERSLRTRSAGQPRPPKLVTRRLPLGDCELLAGLNASKCSLTCLGQVSASGAQAGPGPSLLVGPHHASKGGVVNVRRSQSQNSLCSHRTEMSCQCLIAHAFSVSAHCLVGAESVAFSRAKTRLLPVPPPPPRSHQCGHQPEPRG